MTTSLEKRFRARFVAGAPDKCWLWTGAINHKGYGRIFCGPGHRHVYAHRVAVELDRGPIPDGLFVDHLCRVRNCVNPAHLEIVTRTENTRRGRLAKLTIEAAREIRASDEKGRTLAAQFGVAESVISDIRAGRRWREQAA